MDLKSLRVLNPKVVLDKEVPSLIDLLASFNTIAKDVQEIDTEWRLLTNSVDVINVNSSMTPERFWSVASTTRHTDKSIMFPNLAGFIQTLLCLPHSSAGVDRVFFCSIPHENKDQKQTVNRNSNRFTLYQTINKRK